MSVRIELTFVGDAPENEIARSKILGNPAFEKAVLALRDALVEIGLDCAYAVKTVRGTERRRKADTPLVSAMLNRAAAE